MWCNDCEGRYRRAKKQNLPGHYPTGRFTIKKHPSQYKRGVRCPTCKSFNVRSTEDARRREMAKKELCACNGYPFRHEKGTLRFCAYNKLFLAGVEPTEEEYRQYESCVQGERLQPDSMLGVKLRDPDLTYA